MLGFRRHDSEFDGRTCRLWRLLRVGSRTVWGFCWWAGETSAAHSGRVRHLQVASYRWVGHPIDGWYL